MVRNVSVLSSSSSLPLERQGHQWGSAQPSRRNTRNSNGAGGKTWGWEICWCIRCGMWDMTHSLVLSYSGKEKRTISELGTSVSWYGCNLCQGNRKSLLANARKQPSSCHPIPPTPIAASPSGMNIRLGVRTPVLESWLQHGPAVCCWMDHLTSRLGFSTPRTGW